MSKEMEKEKVEETKMNNDIEVENNIGDSIEEQDVEINNGTPQEEEVMDDKEIQQLNTELQEAKDKYIRLYSEFENFRRRTAKERLELIKSAHEDLMTALLPVMDDFERAQKALKESKDHKASKEGFDLIYNKFSNILKLKGLKPMKDKKGSDFNTEFHEAISQMPVEKKKLKGKVIDVVEKGYYLDEKVIRFAKVVLGA